MVVAESQPEFTTAEAEALGVTRVLSSYSTFYAGSSDRITNLRLAVQLLDGAQIAPGATFSFNDRVGERTLERGFRPAPVIVGDKYEEDVGGGVSQVATTVFNAAWEAGLPISERNPHALYIARYQLGRDATVNYPNLDLKFVNDTGRWIVLGAGAGGNGIYVSLYGSDTGRRVESIPGELRVTGEPKTEIEKDPTAFVGEREVLFDGEPSRAVACSGSSTTATAPSSAARRGRRAIAPRRRRSGSAPSRSRRRREAEARGREARDDDAGSRGHDAGGDAAADDDRDSASLIASTSHAGIRVGRYVCASTVACAVHPSATRSPSRSSRYS